MLSPTKRPGSSGSIASNASTASNAGTQQRRRASSNAPPSTLYNLIMTPINFITFLLSLVIIDIQYSLKRSHNHASANTRLPSWLHALLYRPYEDVRTNNVATSGGNGQWYYSTKQKKLLRMEAEDAFRLRGTILGVLGVIAIGTIAGSWWAVSTVFRRWIPAQQV